MQHLCVCKKKKIERLICVWQCGNVNIHIDESKSEGVIKKVENLKAVGCKRHMKNLEYRCSEMLKRRY